MFLYKGFENEDTDGITSVPSSYPTLFGMIKVAMRINFKIFRLSNS